MSEKDIERINRAYCSDIVEPTTTEGAVTTPRSGLAQSINNFVNNLLTNIFGGIRP